MTPPKGPRTAAGRALLADYYAKNDAREGVGYSLGERILAIEAEAAPPDALRAALERLSTAVMARAWDEGNEGGSIAGALVQARAALRESEGSGG